MLLESEQIIRREPVKYLIIFSAKRIAYASQKNTEQTALNLKSIHARVMFYLLHIQYFRL